MPVNVGTMDRAFRTVIGLYLIAFATGFGFQSNPLSWIGWIGLLPLGTAIVGFCPLYHLLGRSSVYGTRQWPSTRAHPEA